MKQRRSYETGHSPKLLVVADESPEFQAALLFAARRARRTGGRLAAVAVIEPPEAQAWIGVGDLLRQEAEEAANTLLDAAATRVRETSGLDLERLIRAGIAAEEVRKVIEDDEDIVVLVLGASAAKDGPGPLVSTLIGGSATSFPVPVTIVPGDLSAAEIETLA